MNWLYAYLSLAAAFVAGFLLAAALAADRDHIRPTTTLKE